MEQVGNVGVGGLELRQRCGLGLHPMHGEGQEEDEGCKQATKTIVRAEARTGSRGGAICCTSVALSMKPSSPNS